LLDRDEIRGAYVDLLGRAAERTDAKILAYCVMSNHTHVVLVQGQDPLSRLFKPVNTGMAWHANRHRRGRGAKGPVMAQRPRSVLVDEDAYLLELVRYVHNNPVRAGLVRRAAQSTWSSHRAYVGLSECPPWLHASYVLERFGKRRSRAVEAFESFVREGAREPRRPELSGEGVEQAQASAKRTLGDGFRVADGVLGDDAFVERVARDVRAVEGALQGGRLQARLGDPTAPRAELDDVVDAVCAALGVERLSLETGSQARELVAARRVLTWVWVSRFGGRQVDVARALRATSSAVARWYASAREVLEELDGLSDDVVQRVSRSGAKRKLSKGDSALRVRFDVGVEM
jgi:REP element-mobilizing transposase RayT